MKKLFTLFTALLVVITVNADPIKVSPTSPNASGDNIRRAVANAAADAVIELGDGTYTEAEQIKFTKNVTIQAAEGAHPVIAIHYYCSMENGAQVTIKGVKFVGDDNRYVKTKATYYTADEATAYNTEHGLSEGDPGYVRAGDEKTPAVMMGASDHCIRPYSSTSTVGTETLTLKDCEFSGFPNYVLYSQRNSRKWHSLTIENCYFHDNVKYDVAIAYESSSGNSCDELVVNNSTFSKNNVGYAAIYVQNTNTTEVNIDHCTFYNINSHAIETGASVNDVEITNCIFAQPTSKSASPASCGGGTIDHCLSYNTGSYAGLTETNCTTGDPKFLDAANENFTLTTGSPAIGAGTSSSNLGDNRWHPTTIAPAYQYTTYVTTKDLDFSYTPDLVAYYAESATSAGVRMVSVDIVPKGTPLVLKVVSGTSFDVAGAAHTAAPEGNKLRAGDGTTVFNGATWDYILYSDAKFYQISSGTVATDKAYLHLDGEPSSAAGLRMIFDDNGATDINAIEADEEGVKFIENGKFLIKKNGVVYNALGQVVR